MTAELSELHKAILEVLAERREGMFAPDLLDKLQARSYGLFGMRGSIYYPLGTLLDAGMLKMTEEDPSEYHSGPKRFRYVLTEAGATFAKASETQTNPNTAPTESTTESNSKP